MKRTGRWAMLSVGLAAAGTVVMVAPSAATPSSRLVSTVLARGQVVSHGEVAPLKIGTDVAMSQITVDTGGSAGWHSHPGGAIVVVKQGTLTVYSASGNRCESVTYTAGQAFIERPGEVDQVINTGSIPYILYVTFPRLDSPDGSSRITEPAPAACPGI